jgi:uncharacterized DUF497 family protein
MKTISWDPDKNSKLLLERNVSFEDVLFCLKSGELVDDIVHPNPSKYPNQRIFIVGLNNYAYLVPYVEDETSIFLKTIIPSRKATKRYRELNHESQ